MKYQTSSQIRRMFLEYFNQKGHMIEPGAPLVPQNDNTLLWINSGVAALKKYFDGSQRPNSPRIVNSQRSIRTNDIENVGMTARHHTLFEMLGNFSIGDYFKEEAIKFAWEFLTSSEWIGMEKDRMYVTIYPNDLEAYHIWKDVIGLEEHRIIKAEGNFWEIGEGPCGPNSEIFYDRGVEFDPENIGLQLLIDDADNDRYLEVWNIVFSQYNAEEGVARENYKLLPQQNIDTGMGLERLTCLVQGVETNFETDAFMPIIKQIEALSGRTYEGEDKKAFKVIADHIRACTFALNDGAVFSNEGRGYVLKRVLRRAARFGMKLGLNEPFMYKLVPTVVDTLNDYYPELNDKVDIIKNIIKADEKRFHTTFMSGYEMIMNITKQPGFEKVDGKTAFKMYDTYGFPVENLLELGEELNFEVDLEGFMLEMKQQQELARSSRSEDQSMTKQSKDLLEFKETSTFIGYDNNSCQARVIGLFKDGEKVDELEGVGQIIFDQTVFYGESGGQIADSGTIKFDGIEINVKDVTKAVNGQHLHLVDTTPISVGQEVTLEINQIKRRLIDNNHTATHLLHQALKQVVGNHVNQAGSYVTDKQLRFDFTHFEAVTKEQLKKIEKLVNAQIFLSREVVVETMNIEQAKQTGAMALFGEKYGQEVRVVKIEDFSTELCGGCHVDNTSRLGLFKIESESSVGSGTRRIVALTSKYAYDFLKVSENNVHEICHILKINNEAIVVEKTQSLMNELLETRKQLAQAQDKIRQFEASSLLEKVVQINGVNYLQAMVKGEVKDLKALVDDTKTKIDNGVFVFYNHDASNINIVVGVSKSLTKTYQAGNLVKAFVEIADGRGGGKPELAQGGAKNVDRLDEALSKLKELI